jgi:hypothetical protein
VYHIFLGDQAMFDNESADNLALDHRNSVARVLLRVLLIDLR